MTATDSSPEIAVLVAHSASSSTGGTSPRDSCSRVVQASLKLVMEPIFEADFNPCSYGLRPKRRAQDAIAEIHYLGCPSRNYE